MSRVVILLLLCSMLSSACNTRSYNPKASDEVTMLVGTYTSPDGSKGIYSYRFNQESGEITPLSEVEVNNPSYLTLSADNRYVYAVSEARDSAAVVTAFSFDPKDGTFKMLNKQRTFANSPCYIITNGKRVITANYGGGSVSVFPLRYDGSLDSMSAVYEGEAGGPDPKRQAKAHVHCVRFSPDSSYVFATDFGSDRILRYAYNPKEEQLFPLSDSIQLAPGSGPRHLTFSPNGKQAYVINELSGMVDVLNYSNGNFTVVQSVVSDTLAARGSADIHLSPDGRYLYSSNRLQGDGIAIFEVSPEDGTLTRVGYQPTESHPRNFNISPNGKYLLVACRDGNVIQIFARDLSTGELKNTGQELRMSKPVCIKFANEE